MHGCTRIVSRLWVYTGHERSTRGDASIGTIAVVDTCGYTPPHTPSKAVLGVVRGRWSVAGSAERDGDAGGHGVRQHMSCPPAGHANSVRLMLPFLLMHFWHKRSA